jgi:GT2 family glycosyltransferase
MATDKDRRSKAQDFQITGADLVEQKKVIDRLNAQIIYLESMLDSIHRSAGYRFVERARAWLAWIAPVGSARRALLQRALDGERPPLGPWKVPARPIDKDNKRPLDPSITSGQWVAPGARWNEEYAEWLVRTQPGDSELNDLRARVFDLSIRPKITVIAPVLDLSAAQLQSCLESMSSQAYPDWHLVLVDRGGTTPRALQLLEGWRDLDPRIQVIDAPGAAEGTAIRLGMEGATSDFIAFLQQGDLLSAPALLHAVELLNDRELDVIYSDGGSMRDGGAVKDGFLKPGWSPELLRSMNYANHLVIVSAALIERVGLSEIQAQSAFVYELLLRAACLDISVGHLSQPIYSRCTGSEQPVGHLGHEERAVLERLLLDEGRGGQLVDRESARGVRYPIVNEPRIAIVIPTRDQGDLLERCLEGIARSTYRNYKVVLVDNGSSEAKALELLDRVQATVVRYGKAFNLAAMVNEAARGTTDADLLLLLNNDTEVITADWLEAMVERLENPNVGVVGARLLYPDGGVQHDGVVVGLDGGSAGHIDHTGYFGIGNHVRECSAVTGACLMTPYDLFWKLGGMDEAFSISFNDVDYCLRASQEGYRTVVTPFAELVHHEGSTRGLFSVRNEEDRFRRRWGTYQDPYLNPNFARTIPPTLVAP